MKLRWNSTMWNRTMMIAALAVLGGGMAKAQATGGLQSCGFHSATGAYAFRSIGTGTLPDKTIVSAVFVGVIVLDGVGGAYVSNTGSAGGFILRDSNKGTYTVIRDCTGTLTVANPQGPTPTHWDIVIADNGKKILGIITDPGLVFSMEAIKQ